MPLTDVAIRGLKPSDKPQKYSDEKGLFLLVNPNGSKYWRLKYRYLGVEKLQALGVYPEVSLKEARALRDRSRQMLSENIDPCENKKAIKSSSLASAENSFEVVAREWFATYRQSIVPDHADRIMSRMEKDIFPWIGAKAVSEISAPEILSVVRRIANRGAVETAHRAKSNIGQVIRYAIVTGRADRNPTPDLKGALLLRTELSETSPAI